MKIIFDTENIEELKLNHVLLELDTFYISSTNKQQTAYCVIEPSSITELNVIASQKDLHQELMSNFKIKNWDFCQDAIEHLTGRWHGEVDSFYHNLSDRISMLKETELPDDWSPIIVRD